MEFNWLAIDKNKRKITKDFEGHLEFISFNDVDLSFLPDNILTIQWSVNEEDSFMAFRSNDGNVEETPLNSIDEIPNLQEISDLFHEKILEIVEPPPSSESLMNWVRETRREKLEEADIEILRFLEQGQTIPTEWLNYRQALRDIPQQIESGAIPSPTYTTSGTMYIPIYNNIFDSWPTKP